jgi:hypothetical protein
MNPGIIGDSYLLSHGYGFSMSSQIHRYNSIFGSKLLHKIVPDPRMHVPAMDKENGFSPARYLIMNGRAFLHEDQLF